MSGVTKWNYYDSSKKKTEKKNEAIDRAYSSFSYVTNKTHQTENYFTVNNLKFSYQKRRNRHALSVNEKERKINIAS